MEPFARFDDARAGAAFELRGCRTELVARSMGEVAPVIAAAEAAAGAGGWVAGWVAYEAAPGLDPTLVTRPKGEVPLAWFGVFDGRVDVPMLDESATGEHWTLETDARAHRLAVGEIRRRIAAGLTYQVNLTARAHACVADPVGLYQVLVAAQGGTHNALIVTPAYAVACASPELFFMCDDGHITTRPMKGTARRGRWPAEDRMVAGGLKESPKERAENVMIVDLLRNDVGQLAEYGSVRVPSLFDTERYPTMWQLTSTVEGQMRADTTLVDIFRALFPSGSVTGAPKRAAMQTIAELEPGPRGVYCGAVGLCQPGAALRARFAVAIRTATIDLESGHAEYGAGGGITWSSDAGAEWAELIEKTGILRGGPQITGLMETFRSDGANRERHLDRMEASAGYFGIPFDRDTARRRSAQPPHRRVRLRLDVSGLLAVDSDQLTGGDQPVPLWWSEEPVDSGDPLLFHKTLDRERYERRRGARPDVLLVNERGEVTETTIGNVVARIDEQWCTPPLDCGLLPGIERARLLDQNVIIERIIRREEITAATELAVISSLRGWRAAALQEG